MRFDMHNMIFRNVEDEVAGGGTSQGYDFSKLESALADLPNHLQSAVMNGIRTTVQEQNAQQQQQPPQDEPDPTDDELESMSRKDLLAYIEKKFSKTVQSQLKPLQENLQNTSQETERTRIQQQVKEAETSHPDFWEWKTEMGELVQRYPNLSVNDLYTLARANNADKARQLDEARAEKEKPAQQQPRFGGLTPTSGTQTQRTGEMDTKTAAESAWDEVMSGLPKDLIGA